VTRLRVLVLTSDEQRHLHLVGRLCDEGHDVQAWAEAKGHQFGGKNACSSEAVVAHAESLHSALKATVPRRRAEDLPIELFHRGVLKGDDLIGRAKRFAPDAVLVYGSGIIGAPLLSLFPGRFLGSHQGLPQHYRGSGSNFFAFLNREASLMGVSVHILDEGIDTGCVIAQRAPEPDGTDTYYSFSARLVMLTIDLYADVLGALSNRSAVDLAVPLPSEGRLFQRKDFTHEVLGEFNEMLAAKPFPLWHREALADSGSPKLVGTV